MRRRGREGGREGGRDRERERDGASCRSLNRQGVLNMRSLSGHVPRDVAILSLRSSEGN